MVIHGHLESFPLFNISEVVERLGIQQHRQSVLHPKVGSLLNIIRPLSVIQIVEVYINSAGGIKAVREYQLGYDERAVAIVGDEKGVEDSRGVSVKSLTIVASLHANDTIIAFQ